MDPRRSQLRPRDLQLKELAQPGCDLQARRVVDVVVVDQVEVKPVVQGRSARRVPVADRLVESETQVLSASHVCDI